MAHMVHSSVRGLARAFEQGSDNSRCLRAGTVRTPVFSGNQADTNALTDFPSGHSAAHGFNAADDFMSRNGWQTQDGASASDRGCIGVTDSAGFDPNPNLARAGFRNCSFDNANAARRRNFDRPICFLPFEYHSFSASRAMCCL